MLSHNDPSSDRRNDTAADDKDDHRRELTMGEISARWRAEMTELHGDADEDLDNWEPLSEWRARHGYVQVGQNYIRSENGEVIIVNQRQSRMNT